MQPCRLARPFNEKVIGFTVHTEMDFVVTGRETAEEKARVAKARRERCVDAGALPGSFES